MTKFDLNKFEDRYQKMLKFQEEIYPFVPTVRELQFLWGLATPSAAKDVLDKMVEVDRVKTRTKGASTQYYAV